VFVLLSVNIIVHARTTPVLRVNKLNEILAIWFVGKIVEIQQAYLVSHFSVHSKCCYHLLWYWRAVRMVIVFRVLAADDDVINNSYRSLLF